MNKQKLIRFINKYYLSGTVNSVILNCKGGKLSTKFVSGDKTLLGELEKDKWPFEDAEVGVYSTDQFLKLLGVLDEDVNVSINKAGEKAISLLNDKSLSKEENIKQFKSILNEGFDISLPVLAKTLQEHLYRFASQYELNC